MKTYAYKDVTYNFFSVRLPSFFGIDVDFEGIITDKWKVLYSLNEIHDKLKLRCTPNSFIGSNLFLKTIAKNQDTPILYVNRKIMAELDVAVAYLIYSKDKSLFDVCKNIADTHAFKMPLVSNIPNISQKVDSEQ